MKFLKFENFEIESVTKQTEEKPEDIFKIRDLISNYGHLIILRTSTPKRLFYFMLCKRKPVQKKVLQSIIFSNFSNVDYMAIHINTCPEMFKKLFLDGLKIGDDEFSILSASYLMSKIHNRYIKDLEDSDNLNQPHLNYFRYKLECMILMAMNQKGNRPDFVCGASALISGESLEILEIIEDEC